MISTEINIGRTIKIKEKKSGGVTNAPKVKRIIHNHFLCRDLCFHAGLNSKRTLGFFLNCSHFFGNLLRACSSKFNGEVQDK